MDTQAATPTGGAEASARPQETSAPSVQERLKAHLFTAPEPSTQVAPNMGEAQETAAPQEAAAEQDAQQAEGEAEGETTDDAQEDQQEHNFQSVDELIEALGWEQDKLLGLEAKVKIDGKEGKATLRDLVKSYQLEGHLNQKLMTHADEKKAFETERQTFLQTQTHKIQQMDAALQVATRMLEGEYANVNWQELQASDRAEFNARVLEYQQRQQALQHLAGVIGQERQQSEQQAASQRQAYSAEQLKLLESKVPEWSTQAARQKAVGEMAPTFQDAYGISAEELGSVVDHRQLLMARDAFKWQQLQKAKPALTNKVKQAPKLLKPGTQQSKAANSNLQATQARERLRQSGGRPSQAGAALKHLLFR